MLQRVVDGRKRFDDASVVGHAALLIEWNVEVDANEYALVLQAKVADGKFGHASEALLAHEVNHVAHTARVSPLVVVPGDDFYTVARDDARHGSVDDGGARVAAIVHRDQLG